MGIEILIMMAFVSFSHISRLISTIVFPPIFAVTLYFFIIITFDFERKGIKKMDFIYALLLASIALISAGVGFHYAANDINDIFLPEQDLDLQINQPILDRLNFLDEIFSHMIMFIGMLGITLSMGSWWYLRRRHIYKNKVEAVTEELVLDYFIIIFSSVLVGAVASLASMEGNLLIYGVIVLSILSIFIFFKVKKAKRITFQDKDMLLFFITFIATYFAVAVAYYVLRLGLFI